MPFGPLLTVLGHVLASGGVVLGICVVMVVVAALMARNRLMNFALAVGLCVVIGIIVVSAVYACLYVGSLIPMMG